MQAGRGRADLAPCGRRGDTGRRMGEGWSRGIRIVLLVLSGALVLGGLYWKGREILGVQS